MKRKKIIQTTAIAMLILLLGIAGVVYYLFHMPQRDVGAASIGWLSAFYIDR